MIPAAFTVNSPPAVLTDAEKHTTLAAAILFTAEPTDRALAGWWDDMAADDLADMAGDPRTRLG